MRIEGEHRVHYMMKNALRISLGKTYDHTEYCLWLADNAPYYGVVVKDWATLDYMKREKRRGKWKHSSLSKQVQLKIKNLRVDTQVLVLLNSSEFSEYRIKALMRSWPSDRPVLFIG